MMATVEEKKSKLDDKMYGANVGNRALSRLANDLCIQKFKIDASSAPERSKWAFQTFPFVWQLT
jgi:hypothetical protein